MSETYGRTDMHYCGCTEDADGYVTMLCARHRDLELPEDPDACPHGQQTACSECGCPRGVAGCDGTECTWKCPDCGCQNCHEWCCYLCGANWDTVAEQESESRECGYPSESADVTGIVCQLRPGHRGDHMAMIPTYWSSDYA